jgi:hypothetical protein
MACFHILNAEYEIRDMLFVLLQRDPLNHTMPIQTVWAQQKNMMHPGTPYLATVC